MSEKSLIETDIRVLQFHIRHGKLKEHEVEAQLVQLPDEADHGVETSVSFVPGWAGKVRVERPE